MRETRLSGSVEGVVSNHAPYSDLALVTASPCIAHAWLRSAHNLKNMQSVSETGCFRSSFTQPHTACQGSFLLQHGFHDPVPADRSSDRELFGESKEAAGLISVFLL